MNFTQNMFNVILNSLIRWVFFFELWEKYQYFKEFCNLRINYLSDAKFMIE